jgi:uncharacterized protein YggU (UPF0235/DUF167 family)
VTGWQGEVLLVRVAAPPVAGRANLALVRLIADALGIAAGRVLIAAGAASRTKLLDVEEMAPAEVRRRLTEAAVRPKRSRAE